MSDEPFTNPSGTREEILAATYLALGTYGYADLTIKKIGAEFEKSQSLVYHHYNSKDELVLDCLEFMLERFERSLDEDAIDDPRAMLDRVLDGEFGTDSDEEQLQFRRALVELRAQASHDDAYREHFTRSDRILQDKLTEILVTGIESGAFRDHDSETVATTIFTLLSGVSFRRTTANESPWLDDLRDEVESYLQAHVYAAEPQSGVTEE